MVPFGLNVSQNIFQQDMDTILERCCSPGVISKVDDITLFGKDKQDHDHKNDILWWYGVVFNSSKWKISVDKVNLFGNDYSTEGISPSPDKVKDLLKTPS